MLHEHCKQCGKKAIAINKQRNEFLKSIVYTLKCGHVQLESIQKSLESLESSDSENGRDALWSEARPYQREGVEFVEKANYSALIADDMGLGKTIQALLAVRYAKGNLTPTLIVVKSSLKHQWAKETIKWTAGANEFSSAEKLEDPFNIPFIINNSKQTVLPGFKWYIISMDLLSASVTKLKALGLKCVIIDEAQAFKDTTSKRSKALQKIVETIPHRICLSGTPILNRAVEYFPILNLLDPRSFHTRNAFIRDWCEFDYGRDKYTGIKKWRRDDFKTRTSEYIIRRLKSDVAMDLPKFARYLDILDVDDKLFERSYEDARMELEDFINRAQSLGRVENTMLIAILTKLRQIVGMAKVEPCIEYVRDFLDSTDRKICIGIHHRNVGYLLDSALAEYNPVKLTGEMDARAKDNAVEAFRRDDRRVMIASTLAAGEGLNLQFCSDAILLERQWNSAKEVQFEGRFNRIGQTHPVDVRYLMVRNSLDEWMTELIEAKRSWVASAIELEGYDPAQGEGEIDFKELAMMTVQRR